MNRLPGLLLLCLALPGDAKWVQGRIDTKENWAFLSRFCFLSLNGQFEYLIEYEKEMGIPNLLLYYDDDSQWPAVYHSEKSCKEKEAVLNRGQNQIIRLSHWYPDTEYSGCVLTKANKQLPASKSTSAPATTKTTTKKPSTTVAPHPSFYDQFLKTTAKLQPANSTISTNSTTWYEMLPTEWNATEEEDLWESIGPEVNGSRTQDLKDVEILFDNKHGHKIKRSTNELIQRYRRRRLNAEYNKSPNSGPNSDPNSGKERLLVSCHNSRRFRSARERWWFIAISNCDSPKGLDIKYKFLMTNGPDGDFWHEHFSADEFYVLPVLLAYTFAYIGVLIAIAICSVELKSRHLLHSTYKLFVASAVFQQLGVLLQSLACVRYAAQGWGGEGGRITGQFFCGVSEMSYLLLLVLLGKGYTVTRGRLKLGFTVKLTVLMCCYFVTYVVLFVYQAKAFDPGEVLYLYESPAGYGLVVLRLAAWLVFAYSTFCTVKKYPQKTLFYCPFFICGTLWFISGPLFIVTANYFIDKWVRESVVTAVLLFITFCGHVMFLMLTLPVFANKNFPYHVRTTQIGVMEVANSSALDGFGHNAYQPSNGTAQTVIIPLTRRTEELIGNMYSQYMATAPPLSLENTPQLNGIPQRIDPISPRIKRNGLMPQSSTETNHSDDIKPIIQRENDIFTVESQIAKLEQNQSTNLPKNGQIGHFPHNEEMHPSVVNLPTIGQNGNLLSNGEVFPNVINRANGEISGKGSLMKNGDIQNEVKNGTGSENVPRNGELDVNGDLPNVMRSRRHILEPIKRDIPVPLWSLAKGPSVVGMLKKNTETTDSPETTSPQLNGKKVPPVRNRLKQNSGEISTILEGRVQSYQPVNDATVNLFTASGLKHTE